MFEWLFNGKKLRENGVLGMNDRNYSVIAKYNRRSLYTLVDDKVKTKRLANSININTPKMIGIIEHQYQVKNLLDIVKGYDTFVIKPAPMKSFPKKTFTQLKLCRTTCLP